MISFTVHGVPQPAGSKKGFVHPSTGRVVITDDAKKSRPWKAQVSDAAIQSVGDGHDLLRGPLELRVVFHLPRPKGHYGKRGVRPGARQWPAVKPDATKLLRAVEDALTQVVWHDDAQVVIQTACKVYGEPARAEITITTLPDTVADYEADLDVLERAA